MGKKKRTPGIYERGNKWIVNTTYKYHRIWETCATEEMAETNLRKVMTLIDEGRYLEKKCQPKETLGQRGKHYIEWVEGVGQKDVRSKKCRLDAYSNDGGQRFQRWWTLSERSDAGPLISSPRCTSSSIRTLAASSSPLYSWGVQGGNDMVNL